MQLRKYAGPVVAIAVSLVVLAGLVLVRFSPGTGGSTPQESAAAGQRQHQEPADVFEDHTFRRVSDPAGTEVVDKESGDVVARLTDRARTAVVYGPKHTFAEPDTTDATVTTSAWVRVVPHQWKQGAQQEKWFPRWLAKYKGSSKPDALELGTEYFQGAPDKTDQDGVRYAGDADFGPMKGDGSGLRAVGGDYNDYMGTTVSHPDKEHDPPEKEDANALDCSGFLRIVLGYRMGYPMFGKNDTAGDGLQRQVQGMVDHAPGVLLVKDTGKRADLAEATKNMLPGDIVFFETDGEPGLDHSGFYMGKDSRGKHRFMSSRDTINGPTMGDVAGPSILDGNGLFANNFRAVRRL